MRKVARKAAAGFALLALSGATSAKTAPTQVPRFLTIQFENQNLFKIAQVFESSSNNFVRKGSNSISIPLEPHSSYTIRFYVSERNSHSFTLRLPRQPRTVTVMGSWTNFEHPVCNSTTAPNVANREGITKSLNALILYHNDLGKRKEPKLLCGGDTDLIEMLTTSMVEGRRQFLEANESANFLIP